METDSLQAADERLKKMYASHRMMYSDDDCFTFGMNECMHK